MPTDHAILAPSASKRWMACAPSARLEAALPQKDTAYTREGTIAHGMAETLLRTALEQGWTGWPADYPSTFRFAYDAVTSGKGGAIAGGQSEALRRLVDEVTELGLDPWEMMQTVSDYYCRFVWEDYLDAKYRDPDAVLLVEAQLKLSEYIPEGFGSSDAVIIYGKTLCVYDLKYGKGVKVSAKGNTQMRCYALGAYLGPGELYDIDEVSMVIIQPRLQWVSNDIITADQLLDWAENELKPAAIMAYQGLGEYKPGEHCRFCAIAPRCKALALQASIVEAIDRDHDLLSNEQIAELLKKVGHLKSWIANLENYALEQVLAGTPIPGFKVVEGRSLRQISDQQAAMKALEDAGFAEDSYLRPKELKTISDLEKLLKKKGFQELLGQWVVKPAGKPAIVPDDDPRPAMDSAKDDFKDVQL